MVFRRDRGYNVTVITSKHSAKKFSSVGTRIILKAMALVQRLGDLYG
jgi:hypothetical protein